MRGAHWKRQGTRGKASKGRIHILLVLFNAPKTRGRENTREACIPEKSLQKREREGMQAEDQRNPRH